MKINVVVLNVSIIEGMAGSMRVRNLVDPLLEKGLLTVSNLAPILLNEKDKIGKTGSINNVKYLYIGYSSLVNIRQVQKFYSSGINFIKNAINSNTKNILYNYGYPDIKNVLFLIYARTIGYKILFDIVEDNRLDKNLSGFLSKFRNKTSLFLLKRIKYLADAIIFISNPLKNTVEAKTKIKIPSYFIPISINFQYFKNEPGVFNNTNLKIFYGGSYNSTKDGIKYLIKAFNQVSEEYKNITLILTGRPSYQNEMDEILEMIKNNNKIIFKGYLSTDEYYEALNKCDIFCMPRNNTPFAHAGFPFKLGEFLAAGKAIIASNVGDVPNYLEHEKNALLICPESESEIRDAIILCIRNPKLMESIGREAKKTAYQYFDSNVISNRLFDIFKVI